MIAIEPARPEHYERFKVLFAELETGDPTPEEEHYRRDIMPEMVVAIDDEAANVVGCAFSQLFEGTCFVRVLATAPEARRRGVGRALMGDVARRAKEKGADRWQLNVKTTNVPAIRLYEGLGLKTAFHTVVLRIRWSEIAAGAKATEGTAAREVRHPRIDELDAIDRAFDLPAGLAAKNHRDGAKVLRVVSAEAPDDFDAFAAFDARFPGVYPFRAKKLDAALACLADLETFFRPIEDAERPWRADGVQVVVENAAEIAEALLGMGGVEAFRIAQLRGAL